MAVKFKRPWLLCVMVALTNLSQLPFFVDSGTTQYVTYLCWGILGVFTLEFGLKFHKKVFTYVAAFLIMAIISAILTWATDRDYIGTRILYCLIVAIVVLIVSSRLPGRALNYDYEALKPIYRIYILTSAVISVVVYLNYFQTGFSFESSIYEYGSKNSTSQIIITAIILSLFDLDCDEKAWRIFNISSLVINLVLMFLMRSRASIVGLAVISLFIIFSKSVNKKIRILVVIASIIFVCVLFNNDNFYDTVINKILLASRDADDLNAVSSGRFDQWHLFPQIFSEHPIIGRGSYKFESLPLSVLTQYGIFIGGTIILLAVYPALFAFKRKKINKHYQILLVTSLVYLLNGVFEELSPFGPGVKCYFIWFLLGILIRNETHFKLLNRGKIYNVRE